MKRHTFRGKKGARSTPRKAGVNWDWKEVERAHFAQCQPPAGEKRAASAFFDLVALLLASSAVSQISQVLALVLDSSSQAALLSAFRFLTWATAYYFYFFWCPERWGGSPGKLLFGIRVVSLKTGHYPDPAEVFIREMTKPFAYFSFISPFLIATRADRRGLHELLSGTVSKYVRT